MTLQRKKPLPWWGAGMDLLLGFVVFFLFARLIIHSLSTPGPWTIGDFAGYWIFAGVIFAVLVFGFALGLRHDRQPAIIIYPFLLIGTVAIALVFASPHFDSQPGDIHTENPNHCSQNCPGG